MLKHCKTEHMNIKSEESRWVNFSAERETNRAIEWLSSHGLTVDRPNNSWVQAMGFSPEGLLVAGSTSDAPIRFWNWETGDYLRSIALRLEAIYWGLPFILKVATL